MLAVARPELLLPLDSFLSSSRNMPLMFSPFSEMLPKLGNIGRVLFGRVAMDPTFTSGIEASGGESGSGSCLVGLNRSGGSLNSDGSLSVCLPSCLMSMLGVSEGDDDTDGAPEGVSLGLELGLGLMVLSLGLVVIDGKCDGTGVMVGALVGLVLGLRDGDELGC